MVREKLPELLRLTLGTLIIINVHCRDIIESLARKRVYGVDEFEWISQLRYYFFEGELLGATSDEEFGQVNV
jgi:dynein heavy chain